MQKYNCCLSRIHRRFCRRCFITLQFQATTFISNFFSKYFWDSCNILPKVRFIIQTYDCHTLPFYSIMRAIFLLYHAFCHFKLIVETTCTQHVQKADIYLYLINNLQVGTSFLLSCIQSFVWSQVMNLSKRYKKVLILYFGVKYIFNFYFYR